MKLTGHQTLRDQCTVKPELTEGCIILEIVEREDRPSYFAKLKPGTRGKWSAVFEYCHALSDNPWTFLGTPEGNSFTCYRNN